MGGKRKKSDGEEGCEDEPLAKKEKTKKKEILPSMIKDKDKRSEVHAKLKHQKKLEKRKRAKARAAVVKRALELGEEPPAPKIPRTIENTREFDETVCMPDDEEGGPAFISEPLSVIPNAHYYKRGTYDLKKIVTYAYNKEFVSIIVVHTNRREPDALIIMNLPNGPTAHFNLSKLVLRKDIKNHGNPTSRKPEQILNNFTTCLGHCVGRYILETKETKQTNSKGKKTKDAKDFVSQERFHTEVNWSAAWNVQYKGREYEWVHKPEMDTSRRRFFL